MTGETDLEILLKSMKPVLHEGEFVFCTMSTERAGELDLASVCQFREDEGLTLILKRQQADSAGLPYEFVSRMIALTVHSSLNSVGFLAAITSKLAEYGISVNPVSAYYHDYLFVPSDKALETMRLLAEFSSFAK